MYSLMVMLLIYYYYWNGELFWFIFRIRDNDIIDIDELLILVM